jgi:hypothetical protein
LQVIERESEDFDEAAVHEHLENMKSKDQQEKNLACGCPSAALMSFSNVCAGKGQTAESVNDVSALSHWPVQIRLVPPTAPFLKNADLLVAADCTPVAYPMFHRDFLTGKTVMIGCPKFDDAQAYIEKFAQVFQANNIKSVTVVVMEVPCCSGLPLIVRKGMQLAGKDVPMEQIVISARGEVIRKQKLVA